MMDVTPMQSEGQRRLVALQHAMTHHAPLECPLTHRFTPGLYTREIFMPKGALVVSRIHKTEHPYVVMSGRVLVFTEESGVVELRGGHVGITKPGTQRALLMLEDTRWITFHPTTETNLDVLLEELTTIPEEPHLAGVAEPLAILEQLRVAAAHLTGASES